MSETGENGPTPEEIDEAYKINAQIDRGEIKPEDVDKEKEFVITPEIEEKVMAKVQDIFRDGTPFCWTREFISSKIDNNTGKRYSNPKNLLGILKNGALGTDRNYSTFNFLNPNIKFNSREEEWAYFARKHKSPKVYFNIVGRSDRRLPVRQDNKLRNNIFEREYSDGGRIGLIFDLSKWEETTAEDANSYDREKELEHSNRGVNTPGKPHTFSIDSYGGGYYHGFYKGKSLDEIKKMDVSSEFGFTARHRIPPRNFKGIVVSRKNDTDNLETEYTDLDTNYITGLQFSISKDKPQLINPIYDSAGNLLWPRQMSYEEVKKFVAERDAKKASEHQEEPTPEDESISE